MRHLRDDTRAFPADTSAESGTGGTVPRPIQVSIWYPAEREEGNSALTIRDYLADAASEIDFEATDSERRNAAVARAMSAISESGAPRDRIERSLERRTLATRDPDPLPGPFPLLIYSPGRGAGAFQNLVACEYLAGHGYVVAAIPSLGSETREVTESVAGIETGVRDLEFVVDQVGSFPNVDSERIGAIGYSWGGMLVTFLAMHRPEIEAVAALDGSLMVKHHYELARSAPGYDPSKLERAILVFVADAREWKARTFEFFESLRGVEAALVRFHDLFHGDFSSTIIELVLHNLDDPGRDVARVDVAFAWQCRYLLAFMRTYLAGDDTSREFLLGEPEGNGVPENLLSIERSGDSSRGEEREYSVTDVDGNTYRAVTIGTQVWTAENLKVTQYRDGTAIPRVPGNEEWSGLATGAYCLPALDSAEQDDSYGVLYNFRAVSDSRGLCPEGWHVPTAAEWRRLIDFLGGDDVAGGKMRETRAGFWRISVPGATNESGFSAIPAGGRGQFGGPGEAGNYATWWSSTSHDADYAWHWGLHPDKNSIRANPGHKSSGFSVRCVKD